MDKRHFSKTAGDPKKTTFPKYIQDGDKAKTKGTFGSVDDMMRPPRQDLQRIIGDGKVAEGSNLKKTLDASVARAKSMHGNDLFDMDTHALGDFALPGKPESATIIPTSTKNRMSKARAAKAVVDVQPEEAAVDAEHEYAFLSHAMILEMPQKYLQPSSAEVANHTRDTNQSSSDLDKITSIMEGIKTGDDAINFFARFGADSPVSFHVLFKETIISAFMYNCSRDFRLNLCICMLWKTLRSTAHMI